MSRFNLKSQDYLGTVDDKRWFNERLFSAIADEYGWMTHVLSFGFDAGWKRQLVRQLPEMREPACLDLACGNGDIVRLLLDKYPDAHVTGLDIAEPMLENARRRIPRNGKVSFVNGDIIQTSLPDASYDVVTVGYGLRNAPDLAAVMEEMARVITPGGMLATLDFSRWNTANLAWLEIGGLRLWCGLWGLIRSGNPDTYGYIGHSLARFPPRKELHNAFAQHGFRINRSFLHFGGVTETIIAVKE